MMKWLFGLLVLANVMFFAFMQWGAPWLDDNRNIQPQAALNPEKIRLQTASPVAPTVTPAAAPALPPPAAQPPAPALPAVVCMEWGEFSEADFARASAALAALHLGDRLRQRQTEHVSGYWVYIPPLKNRAETTRKIGQLKARGVSEYFVMKEAGKWQNAISLGVFKTEDAAQKFLASLAAKGVVSARAGERMSKLTFTVFELKNLDAGVAGKVSALQKNFSGSELKTVACKTD